MKIVSLSRTEHGGRIISVDFHNIVSQTSPVLMLYHLSTNKVMDRHNYPNCNCSYLLSKVVVVLHIL